MLNLTEHESQALLPCLCEACVERAPSATRISNREYHRVTVTAKDVEVHGWLPAVLTDDAQRTLRAMHERVLEYRRSRRLLNRLRTFFSTKVQTPQET